jgi:hypothetical protein
MEPFLNKPESLRLSSRRVEQLHAIAGALDLSVTEAIAYMIRKEIAAGTIPANVPGLDVTSTSSGIVIRLDDGEPATYDTDGARDMAGSIREVIAGGTSVFNMRIGFSFVRIGRGFKLRAPLAGPEVSMTGDLAFDLADQIEKAAA